jgi:cyclophilin family peptidyl-prolyl cis-trans isomerase
MTINRQVSFGASWSLIGCAVFFCYFLSQLLVIVADNEAYASTITGGATEVLSRKEAIIPISKKEANMVVIQTNKGTITVELYKDKSPKTVENFEKLVASGFYNGVRFHRVIKDFMIQAGDPQSKDKALIDRWGTGGPGYQFADELKGDEKYTRGTLAMANAGPNTNGSQFFIMHKDAGLPAKYTVFGQVVSGIEVVDAIAIVPTYMPGRVDRPLQDIIITSAELK